MLRSLRVIDFRCFESLSLTLEAPMVFLTGENAQGKTSLLEAVAVASRLGSPRASRQGQMVRTGSTGCGVALETEEGLFKSVYQDRKFELTLNGAPCRRSDYLAESPRVVWMENRDLELIRGSGEKRRRYLDAVGSQLSSQYASSLRAYTKALRSRNALLKDGRSGESSFRIFSDLLVQHGQVIIDYRRRILSDLLPYMTESHTQISGKREQFVMQYQPSSESLATDLEQGLQKDLLLKQTQQGPHRDDFSLLVDECPACDYASEGQQRTLAISLRLAQGDLLRHTQTGGEVVYLVDDVFGELDTKRRQALLTTLPTDCQKILTTTSLNWGEVSGQIYTLKEGRLES